jgi:cell wall-associated NlpC family hydrolase
MLGGRTVAQAKPRQRPSTFRPAVETLEDRQAPNNLADLILPQQEALLCTPAAFRDDTLMFLGSESQTSALVNPATVSVAGAVSLNADVAPQHLADALALVQNLDLDNTGYVHGEGSVTWDGTPEAYVDCSGFVNALLQHSYGYDQAQFELWFGTGRPTAADYHDAIVNQVGFTEIASLKDARPGDLLAVKYADPKPGSTGHIMVVAGPIRQIEPIGPLVDGTEQWEVPVIDSALSGHGPSDTRHGKGEGGKDHDGVGQGILRVYTDSDGNVLGYTWSTSPKSSFRDQDDHNLVIGRLGATGAASAPITAEGRALAAVLDGMDVEHHWLAYTKLYSPDVDGSPVLNADGTPVKTSVTHCDAFVKKACDLLGAPMTPGEGSRDHANQQYDWLVDQAASHDDPTEEGWHEVTALGAQALANRGAVVVAACRNTAGNPGHVAMVRPSDKDAAAIFAEGPQIAQAGKVNYNSTSVAEGFHYHPGAWGDTDGANTPVRFFYYRSAS